MTPLRPRSFFPLAAAPETNPRKHIKAFSPLQLFSLSCLTKPYLHLAPPSILSNLLLPSQAIMRPKTHGETPRKKDRKEKEKEKKREEPETHNKKPTKEPSLKGEPALPPPALPQQSSSSSSSSSQQHSPPSKFTLMGMENITQLGDPDQSNQPITVEEQVQMIHCMAVQSQISDETLASMLFPDLPLPIKPVVDPPAKGKYHNQDHTNELFSRNSTSHENTKENKDVAEISDKDNKGRIETFLQGTVLPESSNDRNAWAVLLNTLEKQKIKWRDDHQSVIFLRKKLKKINGIQGTLPADMSLTNYIDNLRISKGIASNLPSNYKFKQVDLEDPTQTARQNLVLLSLAAEFKNPLQAFKDEKFVDNVIQRFIASPRYQWLFAPLVNGKERCQIDLLQIMDQVDFKLKEKPTETTSMFPLCQDNKEVLDMKKQLEKQKSDASKRGTPTQNYGCIICESHKLQTASNHSTKDCKFLSKYKASNRPHYRPDKANSCYFCHIHGWGNHGTKVCRSLPDIIPQQTPPPRTNENPRGNCYQSRDQCGWRGYEREEKEGEREVDNLSTWGCVIQLYLQENTQFIKIREFG